VAPIGVGHGVNSPGWSPPEKRDPRFRLQADNQIIGRFDAISMLSVDAVLVLANPSAAGRTASHDQRYLPDAVRGFHRDHLLSVFG
jgi:hypothetical protein